MLLFLSHLYGLVCWENAELSRKRKSTVQMVFNWVIFCSADFWFIFDWFPIAYYDFLSIKNYA